MMRIAFLTAFAAIVGAVSVGRSQARPDTAQQAAKVLPKPPSKIDPSAAKVNVTRQPSDGKLNGKILQSDPRQQGKVEPSGLRARHGTLDGGLPVTAAERTYALARLNEIERIVLTAAPEFGHLKTPMFAQISGFAGIPKPNTIRNYRYSLFADLGPGVYCEVFYAFINETPRGSPEGAEFEYTMGKLVPGASITWNKLVPPPNPSWEESLFIRDGEVAYHQLTREEVRRWQIVEEEGRQGEKLSQRRELLANTPYQRFMAEAPDRKKTRDELRAVLKGVRTPAEIDAQIKEMEAAERQAAAELKAQDANDRAQNDSLSRAQSSADRARASIARMSAAERKLPAYVKHQAANVDTLFDFGTADTPMVGRVVRPNLAFWNMHRSPVEVRSIHVSFTAGCPKEPPPPDVHAALWKLRQNMDWSALTKMVNEP